MDAANGYGVQIVADHFLPGSHDMMMLMVDGDAICFIRESAAGSPAVERDARVAYARLVGLPIDSGLPVPTSEP